MVRRKDPREDDWQVVTDAKKRKQIQDRLAQRARRQRLRDGIPEPKSKATKFSSHDSSTHGNPPRLEAAHDKATALQKVRSRSISPLILLPMEATNLELSPENISGNPSPSFSDPAAFLKSLIPLTSSPNPITQSHLTLPSPYYSSPSQPLTVLSALYINGEILGLSCATNNTSRSPFPLPHHPFPLHPTETQMLTVHPRWYDRLPFPRMRDSLIRLVGVVDEEELIRDLYLMPSWRIESGNWEGDGDERVGLERMCWDPKFWVMEDWWRDKWGWLMV